MIRMSKVHSRTPPHPGCSCPSPSSSSSWSSSLQSLVSTVIIATRQLILRYPAVITVITVITVRSRSRNKYIINNNSPCLSLKQNKQNKGRHDQTWNLSQAPQACLCKLLLVRVKCLAKHSLFLSQFGLVCVQILGLELTRVCLHYK